MSTLPVLSGLVVIVTTYFCLTRFLMQSRPEDDFFNESSFRRRWIRPRDNIWVPPASLNQEPSRTYSEYLDLFSSANVWRERGLLWSLWWWRLRRVGSCFPHFLTLDFLLPLTSGWFMGEARPDPTERWGSLLSSSASQIRGASSRLEATPPDTCRCSSLHLCWLSFRC